jgi:hypothetical protein
LGTPAPMNAIARAADSHCARRRSRGAVRTSSGSPVHMQVGAAAPAASPRRLGTSRIRSSAALITAANRPIQMSPKSARERNDGRTAIARLALFVPRRLVRRTRPQPRSDRRSADPLALTPCSFAAKTRASSSLHLLLFFGGDGGHACVFTTSRANADVALESVVTATEADNIRHGLHLPEACDVLRSWSACELSCHTMDSLLFSAIRASSRSGSLQTLLLRWRRHVGALIRPRLGRAFVYSRASATRGDRSRARSPREFVRTPRMAIDRRAAASSALHRLYDRREATRPIGSISRRSSTLGPRSSRIGCHYAQPRSPCSWGRIAQLNADRDRRLREQDRRRLALGTAGRPRSATSALNATTLSKRILLVGDSHYGLTWVRRRVVGS